MARTVSIIGSFRKEAHYRLIKEAISEFKKAGLEVLSPKGSDIKNSVDNFVIFESDKQSLSPAEIQIITLNKIIHSDIVYVCNLDGYVGNTTCFEIGFCMSRKIPLYFHSQPKDLPILVSPDRIVTISELTKLAVNGAEKGLDFSFHDREARSAAMHIWPESAALDGKRILVCGSMKLYDEMVECKMYLQKLGISVEIPKNEENLPEEISEQAFLEFKRKASNQYLKKIRDSSTEAILVYNATKNGKDNYIGANTFVEIAMSVAWNRKVYLLNDIYEPYRDELLSWNVVCLNGRLDRLVTEWEEKHKHGLTVSTHYQISMFDVITEIC